MVRAALLLTLVALLSLVLRPNLSGLSRDWKAEGGSVSVVWVVSTQDCLGCQQLTPVLRRLERLRGEGIDLHVIHLGKTSDEPRILRYLGEQRTPPASITSTSAWWFGLTHRVLTPAIIVRSGEGIVLSREGVRRLDEEMVLQELSIALGLTLSGSSSSSSNK